MRGRIERRRAARLAYHAVSEPRAEDEHDFAVRAPGLVQRCAAVAVDTSAAQTMAAPDQVPIALNSKGLAARDWRGLLSGIAAAQRISVDDLLGPSRLQPIVRVRSLAVALLRQRGNSYPQIGRWMNRDHSSIINQHRNWDSRWSREADLRATYDALADAPRDAISPTLEGDDPCTV